MHVSRLRISGVRGFYGDRSVDLDLTRPDGSLAGWTVLAGRNASGKSTLLQALALTLAGPRSVAFVPSLMDWMSTGAARAEIRANIRVPGTLDIGDPETWMKFARLEPISGFSDDEIEPEYDGAGLYSFARDSHGGPFFVGYGPFRHLGNTASRRPSRARLSKRAYQVASLFDETVQLADAIDWLIDQHLYQLEEREGAADLLYLVMTLLSDGLLPDGFEVRRIDSDGLWVSDNGVVFPLREMSDGYRTVTALVVDIIREMWSVYPELTLHRHNGVATLPYSGVILIDEVDAHLHVSWQKKIGTWLKEHFPQIQFIVTTHSPYVCQSADPGGLISLPGPRENRPPQVVDEDLYHRVVYGSGDDAILTELFGIDTPYSPEAEKLRDRLGDLEIKVLDGTATPAEKEEYHTLGETLTSSLSTRAIEVARRLGREG
jgi:hypothetical protein